VLTGIPRGEVDNGGGLLFGSDGNLFVGTGDTGDPALARDPDSLAGKVLRIDVFGRPVGAGPVFSRGHRDVTALCQTVSLTGGPAGNQAGNQALYATDASLDGPDELNAIVEGGNYSEPLGTAPVFEVPADEGGLGGCAAAPSGVFLGALDGERVHVVALDGAGAATGEPEQFLAGQYGRLRTVALDPQGALWITTSNRDGVGTPTADDDRVLRIQPPSSTGSSPL
jgi:glucose/arabinose dehydrogenase